MIIKISFKKWYYNIYRVFIVYEYISSNNTGFTTFVIFSEPIDINFTLSETKKKMRSSVAITLKFRLTN